MIVCTTLSIAPPVKSAKKSLSHFQFFIISNSSTVQIKKYKIKRRKKKQVNKYDDDTNSFLRPRSLRKKLLFFVGNLKDGNISFTGINLTQLRKLSPTLGDTQSRLSSDWYIVFLFFPFFFFLFRLIQSPFLSHLITRLDSSRWIKKI